MSQLPNVVSRQAEPKEPYDSVITNAASFSR